MKSSKKLAVATSLYALFAVLCVSLFFVFKTTEIQLFPSTSYAVFELTDNVMGGFSTCKLERNDTQISANVNIRSGMAYPYAGIGFNLTAKDNRPSNYFDFSKYDSMTVLVQTGRMRNVGIRILTNDPIYSKDNLYPTLRPLSKSLPVVKGGVSIDLTDLNVQENWLGAIGKDKDDGLRYFSRGMFLEIFNGEGTMLGIPDEISLTGIRLWGTNRNFISVMLAIFTIITLAWIVTCTYIFKTSPKAVSKKNQELEALKNRMAKAAKLLKSSDRSISEIAIAVGEKSPTAFEKNFVRIHGIKPLDYRRKND